MSLGRVARYYASCGVTADSIATVELGRGDGTMRKV